MSQGKTIAQKPQADNGASAWFSIIVIVVCLIIGQLIFHFIMGAESNFLDGAEKHKPANTLGQAYLGGFIVPFLVASVLVVITFAAERFISLKKAKGNGDLGVFVKKLQSLIANEQVDDAIRECNRQQGSVANVMRAGLERYNLIKGDPAKNKDQKIAEMQKVLEEATALELPMLSKNMQVIATIVSIGVLLGLLGTVKGMITSFQEMGSGGTPDTSKLAIGISEALINTFTGILASALGIIFYNYFTSDIDDLTYRIDEAGYSLVQTLSAHTK